MQLGGSWEVAIWLHQQVECEALDDELKCEERCEPVIRMFEDVLEIRILIEARRVEHLWGANGAVLSTCMQGGRWEMLSGCTSKSNARHLMMSSSVKSAVNQ